MIKFLQVTVLAAGLALVETFTGACATAAMWNKQGSTYQETVRSFQVSTDGKKLVVLGEKYHYIFDLSPTLKTTLDSPFRSSLRASFGFFNVDADNKITGRYHLHLPRTATETEKQQALAAGFKPVKRTGEHFVSEEISGTRYSAKYFKLPENSAQFAKTYSISVRQPEDASGTIGKILMTPVTLVADGALTVGAVALAAIVLPIAIIADASKHQQNSRGN